MNNTLIISYTPRVDSNTAKLVEAAKDTLAGKTSITHIELSRTPPELLLIDNLAALLKRNFMGEELDVKEQAITQRIDEYTQQVMDADYLIIAFPMYNFSMPATIKAWVDNVIQPGKTFTITQDGGYQGLCEDTKALILMTAGNDFSEPPMSDINFATPLMQSCLNFMGMESEIIIAFGLNQYADRADDIVTQAQGKISQHLQQYF